MPQRDYSSTDYRYGFQGQEVDKEMPGGTVSYKYRVRDARIRRFLSVDPLAPKYPWNSSYAFSENRVIDGVELEGLEFAKNTSTVSAGSNFGSTLIDPTININKLEHFSTKLKLTDIRLESRGWIDEDNSTLSDFDLTHHEGVSDYVENQKLKGAGNYGKHGLRGYGTGLKVAGGGILLIGQYFEYKLDEIKGEVTEDFYTIKGDYETLGMSIDIVNATNEIGLVPTNVSLIHLVNYINNSELPQLSESITQDYIDKVEALGVYMFERRSELLSGEIPSDWNNGETYPLFEQLIQDKQSGSFLGDREGILILVGHNSEGAQPIQYSE